MAWLLIDDLQSAAPWSAHRPDDTPSPELALVADTSEFRHLPDQSSGRVEASASSTGHYLRRALPALDLDDLDELRFWLRSGQPADGSPERPFRLRVELGSAALPVGAPGNEWRRLLPVEEAGRWQFVRLALDDLAPAVRGAAAELRLTVVDAAGGFTAWLDDLAACRPELLADVDTALLALLDGTLSIGGVPVPAEIAVPGAAAPGEPWLRLTPYDVAFSDLRTGARRPRTDFTDAGFRIRPESVAYDLAYRIEAVTSDRGEQAQILEFVLDVLGARRDLLVAGLPHPAERVAASPPEDAWNDAPVLRYRIQARRERGAPRHVLPVAETVLTTDLQP